MWADFNLQGFFAGKPGWGYIEIRETLAWEVSTIAGTPVSFALLWGIIPAFNTSVCGVGFKADGTVAPADGRKFLTFTPNVIRPGPVLAFAENAHGGDDGAHSLGLRIGWRNGQRFIEWLFDHSLVAALDEADILALALGGFDWYTAGQTYEPGICGWVDTGSQGSAPGYDANVWRAQDGQGVAIINWHDSSAWI